MAQPYTLPEPAILRTENMNPVQMILTNLHLQILAVISIEIRETWAETCAIVMENFKKRIDVLISQKGRHFEYVWVCLGFFFFLLYHFVRTLYLHHLLIHCWKHYYLSNKTYLNHVIISCMFLFFIYAWNSISYYGTPCMNYNPSRRCTSHEELTRFVKFSASWSVVVHILINVQIWNLLLKYLYEFSTIWCWSDRSRLSATDVRKHADSGIRPFW